MTKNKNRSAARLRTGLFTIPTVVALAAAGCDTSVTNPGPVQDAFLDSLTSHQAIVNGAKRSMSDAMGNIAYWSGVLVYEVNPAGSTGSFGIPTWLQAGRWDANQSGDWNAASEARFVAEDALRRFEEVLPNIPGAPAFGAYALAAEAAVLAGFANRIFGETFCAVVFDGGPEQPFYDAFSRAEGYFTQAISIANAANRPDLATAATAGRAQVRANLAAYGQGSWSDAASDASGVSNSFVHVTPYSDQDQSQGNRIMVASPGLGTYRAHTNWGTYYEDYFRTTGDARVPIDFTPSQQFGDAAVTKFGGNVFLLPQDKYNDPEDPIRLASGWEMRLIEAEAALQAAGGAGAAIGFMNQRRQNLGLANRPVGTDAEAYTALKAERMLELWLENRRMFDLRRWQENNVNGGLADVLDGVYGTGTANVAGIGEETPVGVRDNTLTTLGTNAKCFTIGDSEYDTNTNLTRPS